MIFFQVYANYGINLNVIVGGEDGSLTWAALGEISWLLVRPNETIHPIKAGSAGGGVSDVLGSYPNDFQTLGNRPR
jgi:hypothetical protein